MKSALLVQGTARCFDTEKFAAQHGLGVKHTRDEELQFSMCFETQLEYQARRWAILYCMQTGAHVVRITGVHPSISHSHGRYVFYVGQTMVSQVACTIPEPCLTEPPDDLS